MEKSSIVISIVLTILGLIYMYLDYHYDIVRRTSLSWYNIEDYVRSYSEKNREDRKDKVIVCFSSNKNKIPRKEFINSLLDQSYKIDELVIIIPYRDIGSIPESMKKVLSIHGYSKDYGNASTIICSVLREPEANTKIIIVEPNFIYGKDFVYSMVHASDQNPDRIIYGKDVGDEIKDENSLKYGILVKPKFFDDKISNYENGNGCCPWIDKCTKVQKKVINYTNVV